MLIAARDLYYGLKRKKVLEEEISDCQKIWRFVDDQLYAELGLAQCEIDWAKERLYKQGSICVALIVAYVVYSMRSFL